MYVWIVALITLVLVAPARAQVHVDIGIHLPAPPRLVVVPEVRAVQYAAAVPVNMFLYGGQYWVFTNGGWLVGPGYNGPWIAVAPQFVPRPILLVPVAYYHVPPGHWKKWNKHQPPLWAAEWGPEWSKKRAWKAQGRKWEDGKGKGKATGHGKGRDK
jgi:hypothetical protein